MRYAIPLILALVALSACAPVQTDENAVTGDVITLPEYEPGTIEPEIIEPEPANEEPVELAGPDYYTITRTEGDLVILSPEAIDPDGDEITFTYTAPFGKDGRWQTGLGDEGEHLVTITATDTKGASASEVVRVVITRANRAPSLSCPARVLVQEGDVVVIDCTVTDEDAEEVVLTYGGWMSGRERVTSFSDEGEYTVRVTATDGSGNKDEATVKIIVENVNRAPSFPGAFPSRIVAQEGDVVTIDTSGVSDVDGDALMFTFSEPFDDRGVWRTEIGDAGEYPVDVVANDGTASAKESLQVIINMVNTAPVLKRIPDVIVTETQTIELKLSATDREDDELTYTVSGWMSGPSKTTTFDDAGEYTAKVVVSDGELEDSQVVNIIVRDKNRAPVFKRPA